VRPTQILSKVKQEPGVCKFLNTPRPDPTDTANILDNRAVSHPLNKLDAWSQLLLTKTRSDTKHKYHILDDLSTGKIHGWHKGSITSSALQVYISVSVPSFYKSVELLWTYLPATDLPRSYPLMMSSRHNIDTGLPFLCRCLLYDEPLNGYSNLTGVHGCTTLY